MMNGGMLEADPDSSPHNSFGAFVYICTERERERERKKGTRASLRHTR